MKKIKQGQTRWATETKLGPDNRVEIVYVLACQVFRVTRKFVYYRQQGDGPFTVNAIPHHGWRAMFPTYRKAMRHAVDLCKRTDVARDSEYLEAWGD